MKKLIVGALVGGIIVFIWSFLSWGLLNLHSAGQQYTPKQDSILAYLRNTVQRRRGLFYAQLPTRFK